MDGVDVEDNSIPAYGWIEKDKEKLILSNMGNKRITINGAVDVRWLGGWIKERV